MHLRQTANSIVPRNSRRLGLLRLLIIFLFALPAPGQPPASDAPGRAAALFSRAEALTDEGTAVAYQEARSTFQSAYDLFRENGDRDGEARSLVGLGFTSASLDEKRKAIDYYEEARVIFKALGNKEWEARVVNNTAMVYDAVGETRKAIELLGEALVLRRAAGDQNGEGVTLNNLGFLHSNLGERETALTYYQDALKLRRAVKSQRGEAMVLNNIGMVYFDLGDNAKALEFFELALQLRRAMKDRRGEAITVNNIALVLENQREYAKALSGFNQSLEIMVELGEKSGEATALDNIGTVYLEMDENAKALGFFEKSLAITLTTESKDGQATTLNNIGLAKLKLKKGKEARESLNRALPILRSTGNRAVEAIALNNLMHAWKYEKNTMVAIFYGKQAVNKYQELREAIKGLDRKTQKSFLGMAEATYRTLADLLIEAGRFGQAEQVLKMLKDEEYFDFVRRDSGEIKNLDKRVPLDDKEQALIRRYQVLAERITEIGREFTAIDDKRRRLLSIGSSLSAEDQAVFEGLSASLTDANAAFNLFLEKDLVRAIGAERAGGIRLDRGLQNDLRKWGNGTVALYTLVTEDRYRVILTTPAVQVDGKTEIPASELNKKVFAYREALQNLDVDPRPLGKELYDILLKPIEKDLKAAGAKTLVWSLDGTLRYLPMAALSPDGQTYLVEKYENVVITQKTRAELSSRNRDWRALGLGVSEGRSVANPDSPENNISFSALPGTKSELLKIVRNENAPDETGILSGRRLEDNEFTFRNLADSLAVEAAGGEKRYTVVHIASHFRLGSNWSNSFLLLGNGQILTLEQISSSPEISFGDVELITLSACNTAFADDSNGKEVDSLAGVIQAKSGKAIIATLWAVVDESTPVLMSDFYRLRKDVPGTTKSAAIRDVQSGMISGRLKPGPEYIDKLVKLFMTPGEDSTQKKFVFDPEKPFAHPYFWSPFILIGNWR